jgi:lysophospholipase L1-like esterase
VQAVSGPWFRLSLLANAVFALAAVAFVVRRSVLSRAAGGDDLYARERLSLFAAMPAREGGTVFLGDSLTDRGEWAETFGDAAIRNRGVAGDTTRGVLARIDDVAGLKPARVFLQIGVNDLGDGEAVPAVAERYAAIVVALRARAPQAKLHCESVFPVRESLAPRAITGAKIRALNEAIARIAAENACAYVDVATALAGPDGGLEPRFTLDGMHLTGEGYAAWAKAIAPWMNVAR